MGVNKILKCVTCKHGSWIRFSLSEDFKGSECLPCCGWNDKYEPLETDETIKTDETD